MKNIKAFSLILSLTTFNFLGGCSLTQNVSRAQTQYGSFEYVLSGAHSEYTIILEAGVGDDMFSWRTIFKQLTQKNTVFAYNRIPHNFTKASIYKGDGKTKAENLKQLLISANVAPPYLLVGHSLGGSFMELFTRMFPEEVTGLVLLDSRASNFSAICQAYQASFCQPPNLLKAFLPKIARKEIDDENATMSQIKSITEFPQIPVAIVTGMKKEMEGEKFTKAWLESQMSLKKLSTNHKHFICKDCGHYVHHDNADMVLTAIDWVKARL